MMLSASFRNIFAPFSLCASREQELEKVAQEAQYEYQKASREFSELANEINENQSLHQLFESKLLPLHGSAESDLRNLARIEEHYKRIRCSIAILSDELERVSVVYENMRKTAADYRKYLKEQSGATWWNFLTRLVFKPVKLTPVEREHRIRDQKHIEQSLVKQLARAAEQMKAEKDDAYFQFLDPLEIPSFDPKTSQKVFHLESGKVGSFLYSACHFQGARETMEDEHASQEIELNVRGRAEKAQVFGIFDGHNGKKASEFLRNYLAEKLKKNLEIVSATDLTDVKIWNALKLTFVGLDEEFKHLNPRGRSGTTACVAFIIQGKLWIANLGDSRAILNQDGTPIQCSKDMVPGDPDCIQRFANRGSAAWYNFREGYMYVDANPHAIPVGSIGDVWVPNGGMGARPWITCFELKRLPAYTHLILGCDGIWDVASSRQIVRGIQQYRENDEADLARAVVGSAYKAGSKDNLSALVVRLK